MVDAPEQREPLYEGKAKIVYATSAPDRVIIEYKDDATAFNAEKRGTIANKGVYNNKISSLIFEYLNGYGVPTHFLARLDDRRQLAYRMTIIPLEVVVRNVAAGSLAQRLGVEEGTPLRQTVLEYYYKRDDLGDPMLNRDHVFALELADSAVLDEVDTIARRVNDLLRSFLAQVELDLIDFKLEFGVNEGRLYLADEISPDTCRFWDTGSGERLDKDRFRRDLGGVGEAYREVLRRLEEGEKAL